MQDKSVHGQSTTQRTATPISAEEAERFGQALDYLREHFRTAGLKDVAAHVATSPFHFHRRFRLWAGRTPKALITEFQIEHAKSLLLRGDVPLAEVARQCGFAHQSHMTARFRRMVGDSPNRWLRKQSAAAAARPPIALDADVSLVRAAA